MRCWIILILTVTCLIGAERDDSFTGRRGPHGNGIIQLEGPPLVDDGTKATRIWTSEEPIPQAYISPNRFGKGKAAGYTSPVVVGDRVYIRYELPAGDEIEEGQWKKCKGAPEELRQQFAIMADDVVLCVDAKTGKTVWKRVFTQKAFNPRVFGGIPYATVCHHAGVIYSLGMMGMAYAVDAKTGEVIWETEMPTRAFILDRLNAWRARDDRFDLPWVKGKNRLMDGRKMGAVDQLYKRANLGEFPFKPRSVTVYIGSPTVAGKVVVMTDCLNGMVGLDLATGKLAWHVKNAWGGTSLGAAPYVWTHGGKDFIIFRRGHFDTVCLDPTQGTELWQLRDRGINTRFNPCLHGDFLLCQSGQPGEVGPACYRLSLKGPELLWRLDARYAPGTSSGVSPLTVWGENCYFVTGFRSGTKADKRQGRHLIVVRIADGTVLHDVELSKEHNPAHSCPTVSAGTMIMFTMSGKQALFDLESDPPKPLGAPFGSVSWATEMSIVDGFLYTRSKTGLECWDLRQ